MRRELKRRALAHLQDRESITAVSFAPPEECAAFASKGDTYFDCALLEIVFRNTLGMYEEVAQIHVSELAASKAVPVPHSTN